MGRGAGRKAIGVRGEVAGVGFAAAAVPETWQAAQGDQGDQSTGVAKFIEHYLDLTLALRGSDQSIVAAVLTPSCLRGPCCAASAGGSASIE